jgi:CCR4-NOT transcription complex subunit 7/8
LNSSGIDFEVLSEKGILFEDFAEYFVTSGLILNEDIHWISFHGSYDFAYLLKMAIGGLTLPENEINFLNDLEIYFKNFYDIRFLLKNFDNFKGSLNKIAQELDVIRIGSTHQAGSDSIVTSEVFFKLFKKNLITGEIFENSKNILFGLGEGADENEMLTYTFFGGNNNNVKNNNISANMSVANSAKPINVIPNYNVNISNYNHLYMTQSNLNNNPSIPNNPVNHGNHNNTSNNCKQNQPLNVLYPISNNSNLKNGMYNYGASQLQMYNISNINGINNNNFKTYSSNQINVLNSGNYNNTINNGPVNKEKKKNFGKTILEAYSN